MLVVRPVSWLSVLTTSHPASVPALASKVIIQSAGNSVPTGKLDTGGIIISDCLLWLILLAMRGISVSAAGLNAIFIAGDMPPAITGTSA